MLDVGAVVTKLAYRVDDSGADRYERRTKGLRHDAHRDIKTDAKLDVDRRGFDKFSHATAGAERDAGHLEKRSHRTRGALGLLGKGAGIAGVALGAGLAVGAKKAWTEFQEAAKVGAQTEAVIKSTGGAANVTAGDVAKLSTALSAKSGIDDEVVQKGANVMLTFRDIRNEAGKGNDVFNQATTAALDMSVALGKDLTGSSIMIGKALNDPIKGITALGRAGVQFTKGQKEQITTLAESGDKLGAQKLILAELNKEFKGSAEAQARPMDRAKVAVLNLFEAIGGKLAPGVEFLATKFADLVEGLTTGEGAGGRVTDTFHRLSGAASAVAAWVGRLVDAFSGGDKDATKFAGSVGGALRQAFGAAVSIVKQLISAIEDAGPSFEIIGRALLKVGEFVMAVFSRVVPAVKGWLEGLIGVVKGAVDLIAGILTLDFGRIVKGLREIFGGLAKMVWAQLRGMTAPIREIVSRIPGLFAKLPGLVWNAVKGLATLWVRVYSRLPGLAWAAVKGIVGMWLKLPGLVWGALKAVVTRLARWNVELRLAAARAGLAFAKRLLGFFKDLPGDVWGFLKSTVTRAARFARDLAGKAVDAGRGVLRGVARFLKQLPGDVWDFYKRAVTRAARFERELIDKALSAGRGVLRGVVRFVKNLPGDLASIFKRGVSRAASFAGDLASKAADAGRRLVKGVVDRAKALPGELAGILRSGVSKVGSFSGNFFSKALDVGKNVVKGIASGLAAIGGVIVDAGKGLARKVIGAVKSALGISSPSREFMDVGREIVNGLIAGMDFDNVRAFIGKAMGGLKKLAIELIKGGGIKVPLKLVPKLAKFLAVSPVQLARWAGHKIDDLPAKALDKLGLRRGGTAGPGEGGPIVVYGEGSKREWWVSQEGDHRQNVGWATEALETLTGRDVILAAEGHASKKKRKKRKRKKYKAPSASSYNATAIKAGEGALADRERGVDEADRIYGQLERAYSITEEEFLIEKPDGSSVVNKGAVNKRVAEINALVDYLRRVVEARIRKVEAAINNLIRAYKRANKLISSALGRKGKKRIKGSKRGEYRAQMADNNNQIKELRDSRGGIPLDIQDRELDVRELLTERAEVWATKGAAAEGGPGGTGAPTPTDVARAAAEQFGAFQAGRSELYAGAGANFAAAAGVGASVGELAAGRRAFGAFGGEAGPGQRVYNQEFHFSGAPSDAMTFTQRVGLEMRAAAL